jgi:hypothetical protein
MAQLFRKPVPLQQAIGIQRNKSGFCRDYAGAIRAYRPLCAF